MKKEFLHFLIFMAYTVYSAKPNILEVQDKYGCTIYLVNYLVK